MNRTGLGLALGAGYVLGRTKKMKLAVALGTMAAGRRMNLSPKGITDLVSTQLRDNPQLKEMGDQLRSDLRGVGQAASGAMVERQMNALADRLHGRTAEVRDQLSGAASTARDTADTGDTGTSDEADDADAAEDAEPKTQDESEGAGHEARDTSEGADTSEDADTAEDTGEGTEGAEGATGSGEQEERDGGRREARGDRAGRKARPESRKATRRSPATKAAARTPGKAPGRSAGKTQGKAAGKKPAARARQSKGGEER